MEDSERDSSSEQTINVASFNCKRCLNCTLCEKCTLCVACNQCSSCVGCEECLECSKCVNTLYSQECENCVNCENCYGCSNLKDKKDMVFNLSINTWFQSSDSQQMDIIKEYLSKKKEQQNFDDNTQQLRPEDTRSRRSDGGAQGDAEAEDIQDFIKDYFS